MDVFNIPNEAPTDVKNYLEIILYLLPGLITYYTYRYCRTLPKHSPFETVIHAIFYTVIDLLLFSAFSKIDFIKPLLSGPYQLYALYILAVIVGVVFAWIEYLDLPLTALRFLRLTDNTNRVSIWEDVSVYNPYTYVRIFTRDKEDLYYEGFLKYYSAKIEPIEVFLIDVTLYRRDTSNQIEALDTFDGFYVKGDNIKYIQYLELPRERLLPNHRNQNKRKS